MLCSKPYHEKFSAYLKATAKRIMKDIQFSERLKEVALLFLRLGATSFGGPAAYIGLMHHEIVVRRKWVE